MMSLHLHLSEKKQLSRMPHPVRNLRLPFFMNLHVIGITTRLCNSN